MNEDEKYFSGVMIYIMFYNRLELLLSLRTIRLEFIGISI